MDYGALQRDSLLISGQIGSLLDDPHALANDAARGYLVKLRRGAYVTTPVWEQSTSRQRHVLRVRAALAVVRRPVIVAGLSAAALWGMPVANEWPRDVTFLDEWRGGGKSEPGVRFTSFGYSSAEAVLIDGIRTTTLARTAIDVARGARFSDAAGSVDWAVWRKNPCAVTTTDLHEELQRLTSPRGSRRMRRTVEFATSLSDSFGESEARAVIEMLGFERPELQVEFRDSQGLIIPDFFWRRTAIAAEFDGKQKYTRGVFTNGDPAEVVWKEKKREDRLRRMVDRVERIITSEVKNPSQLERLLVEAGVPRALPPHRGVAVDGDKWRRRES